MGQRYLSFGRSSRRRFVSVEYIGHSGQIDWHESHGADYLVNHHGVSFDERKHV